MQSNLTTDGSVESTPQRGSASPEQEHPSYFYQSALQPNNPKLISILGCAASAVHEKLMALDLGSLGISEYNQRYLGNLIKDSPGAMEDYTQLLLYALNAHSHELGKITLVDHGGGSGLVSLLAKNMGVGKVIYADIYDVSCRDAQTIGHHLGTPADLYVCGDIQDLCGQLSESSMPINVLVSFNVIEHIYNLPDFIKHLCSNLGERSSIVMASSANTLNPRTRYLTMKHQRVVELQDRQPEWGHKQRDSIQAYRTTRKEIIQKEFPELTPQEIEILAKKTRGMMRCDILEAVKMYRTQKVWPNELPHRTNTCDPMTGNWDENLLDPFEVLDTIKSYGLNGQVLPGYYSRKGSRLKRRLKRALNFLISQMPTLGLRAAPHYLICARNF